MSCDSCSLKVAQVAQCALSLKWQRRRMRSPYGCPTEIEQFQSLESRLIAAKSHKCGSGRCSCKGGVSGNANPNGDSYPTDIRCTGPETYDIMI